MTSMERKAAQRRTLAIYGVTLDQAVARGLVDEGSDWRWTEKGRYWLQGQTSGTGSSNKEHFDWGDHVAEEGQKVIDGATAVVGQVSSKIGETVGDLAGSITGGMFSGLLSSSVLPYGILGGAGYLVWRSYKGKGRKKRRR